MPFVGWTEPSAERIFDQAQKHQNAFIEQNTFEPFQPSEYVKSQDEPNFHDKSDIPCQLLQQVMIENGGNAVFDDYVFDALMGAGYQGKKDSQKSLYHFVAQPCLTASDIESIVTTSQNALIDDGWVTTRVIIPEQNIKSGTLRILLLPGMLNRVMVNSLDDKNLHIQRLHTFNALPVSKGKPLNLRDIEQGLENLRRLPTVMAKIDIAPSEQSGSSDLVVNWSQKSLPLRIHVGMDNSGTKETGKYLGSLYFSYDNPLRLNDIFSASYTRNLLPGKKQIDISGNRDAGETNNFSLNYSIPYQYWALALNYSQYFYDQIVAGQTKNYHYSGKSQQWQANLSNVIYRNQRSKLTLSAGLWAKRNYSFINDTEVGVQRRQTGGWQIGIEQLSYFSKGTLSSAIRYKKGERWFGAIPAPEEKFDEGTARMGVVTADIHWNMPFLISNQQFSWDTQWHGQYSFTKLTPIDKLSIGGRYTVRGFEDGLSLSAEKGVYTQNNIAWHYRPTHQMYLGLDAGYVDGLSTKYLPGKYLVGSALGMKGSHDWYGQWHYDAYIGKTLVQPKGLKSQKMTFGFSLNYQIPL